MVNMWPEWFTLMCTVFICPRQYTQCYLLNAKCAIFMCMFFLLFVCLLDCLLPFFFHGKNMIIIYWFLSNVYSSFLFIFIKFIFDSFFSCRLCCVLTIPKVGFRSRGAGDKSECRPQSCIRDEPTQQQYNKGHPLFIHSNYNSHLSVKDYPDTQAPVPFSFPLLRPPKRRRYKLIHIQKWTKKNMCLLLIKCSALTGPEMFTLYAQTRWPPTATINIIITLHKRWGGGCQKWFWVFFVFFAIKY